MVLANATNMLAGLTEQGLAPKGEVSGQPNSSHCVAVQLLG